LGLCRGDSPAGLRSARPASTPDAHNPISGRPVPPFACCVQCRSKLRRRRIRHGVPVGRRRSERLDGVATEERAAKAAPIAHLVQADTFQGGKPATCGAFGTSNNNTRTFRLPHFGQRIFRCSSSSGILPRVHTSVFTSSSAVVSQWMCGRWPILWCGPTTKHRTFMRHPACHASFSVLTIQK
jgi:hypothetical protein